MTGRPRLSELRDKLKQDIIAEYQRQQPECAAYAEQIINHLFTLPQMQSDDDVVQFYEKYKQALVRGVGSGIL